MTATLDRLREIASPLDPLKQGDKYGAQLGEYQPKGLYWQNAGPNATFFDNIRSDLVKPVIRQGGGVIGGMLYNQPGEPGLFDKPDPDFDWWNLAPETYRERYKHRYSMAKNRQQVDAITAHIQGEERDYTTIGKFGLPGLAASFAFGAVSDPLGVVPIVGFGDDIAKSARFGQLITNNALRGAAAHALAGAGVMTVGELSEHLTRTTKTFGDDALNIGVGTFASGILGGAKGLLTKNNPYGFPTADELEDMIMGDLDVPLLPASQYGVPNTIKSAQESADVFNTIISFEQQKKSIQTFVSYLESRLKQETGVDDAVEAQRTLGASINKNRERVQAFQGMIESAPDDATRKSISRQFDKVSTDLARQEKLLSDLLGERKKLVDIDGLLQPESRSGLTETGNNGLVDILQPDAIEIPADVMAKDFTPDGESGTHTLSYMTNVLFNTITQGGQPDKMYRWKIFQNIWPLNRQSPLMRLGLSKSPMARKWLRHLSETVAKYEDNMDGIASPLPVEVLQTRHKGNLADAITEARRVFANYGQRVSGQQGRLDRKAFFEAVTDALNNGNTHVIPEVADVANLYRQALYNPIARHAQSLKALGQPLDLNNYSPRYWDVQKILDDPNTFVQQVIKPYLLQGNLSQYGLLPEVDRVARMVMQQIIGSPSGRVGYEGLDDLVDEVAAEMLDRRYAMSQGWNPDQYVAQRKQALTANRQNPTRAGGTGLYGPLAKRQLAIDYQSAKPWLIRDAEFLVKNYQKTMDRQLALVEKFDTTDFEGLREKMLAAVVDDWNTLISQAKPGQVRKLEKLKTQDLKDLAAVLDKRLGRYGLPADPTAGWVKTLRFGRQMTHAQLGGMFGLLSLSDIPRIMGVFGAKRFIKTAPFLDGMKGISLTKRETMLAHDAADMVTKSLLENYSDLVDELGRPGMMDRIGRFAADVSSVTSGLAHLTQFEKQWASYAAQTRILEVSEALLAGQPITRRDRSALAASYIDEPMAQRIADQYRQFGNTQGSVRIANTGLWTDGEAADIFRFAVNRDVRLAITTPGDDLPLFMSTELGKTMLQFKSFFMSAAERVFLANTQDLDASVVGSLVLGTTLGIMTSWLYNRMSDVDDSNWSPQKWLVEGVDKAGVTGWFFELNNSVELLSGGRIGINPLIGEDTMSRYKSRSATDALVGPLGGRLNDIMRLSKRGAQAAFPKEGEEFTPTENDVRLFLRMLPFHNNWLIRGHVERAAQGLGHSLGVEPDED